MPVGLESLHTVEHLAGTLDPAQRLRIPAEPLLDPRELYQQVGLEQPVAGDLPLRGRVGVERLAVLPGLEPRVAERLLRAPDLEFRQIGKLAACLERARIKSGGCDVGVDIFRALCGRRRVAPCRSELAGLEVVQGQHRPRFLRKIHFRLESFRDRAVELSPELERQALVG